MKNYAKAFLTAFLMVFLSTACEEQTNHEEEEIAKINNVEIEVPDATEGDKVKRPGGGG